MPRESIPVEKLLLKPHYLWDHQWALLTSGDFAKGEFNSMTVGWGSLGTMWGKPFAQVVVRPIRYTYRFMEQYDTFTLCTFGEDYRKALELLGTKSGRDGDKIAESGLTPIASTRVAAPGFRQAELIVECRKIYWDDMEPGHFLDPHIEENYPQKDYHRIYFGEILAISGERAYRV
ncbi:MAG: flavin reductase [Deltaproteobacteria bacterium]|nr:flavin reductase [Deltaproteobacteria bacterium]MBW2121167.1 flavin reductase [Deltaproteobacteria bacterium]